ncbi:MAG: GDPmannose 4,6-dehydratase [Algoriphagus sp.]|jgi:GDPmannose 4,6-dehydratase
MSKKALIIGISGQDGSYLAKFLLKKDYEVWGSSRDSLGNSFKNLNKLAIIAELKLISIVVEDFRSVLVGIKKAKPDEIYFLAGQSSVGLSFEQPVETIQSILIGILNVLEAVKMVDHPVRVYHAGSSEVFGDTLGSPATELTPFRPRSPYGLAKASAFWSVDNYREAYNLYACTGLLFNHESPLRPERFVSQKIIQAAKRIAKGSTEKLVLGRIDISRDWGWAPEYVEAMWLMLQQDQPDDFIIATGDSATLEEFVDYTFCSLGLKMADHLEQSAELIRPTELSKSIADSSKAFKKLGWKPKKGWKQVIDGMLNH